MTWPRVVTIGLLAIAAIASALLEQRELATGFLGGALALATPASPPPSAGSSAPIRGELAAIAPLAVGLALAGVGHFYQHHPVELVCGLAGVH